MITNARKNLISLTPLLYFFVIIDTRAFRGNTECEGCGAKELGAAARVWRRSRGPETDPAQGTESMSMIGAKVSLLALDFSTTQCFILHVKASCLSGLSFLQVTHPGVLLSVRIKNVILEYHCVLTLRDRHFFLIPSVPYCHKS